MSCKGRGSEGIPANRSATEPGRGVIAGVGGRSTRCSRGVEAGSANDPKPRATSTSSRTSGVSRSGAVAASHAGCGTATRGATGRRPDSPSKGTITRRAVGPGEVPGRLRPPSVAPDTAWSMARTTLTAPPPTRERLTDARAFLSCPHTSAKVASSAAAHDPTDRGSDRFDNFDLGPNGSGLEPEVELWKLARDPFDEGRDVALDVAAR